ncbi:MAG: sodium-dependent bicarbonate transport family permease [Sinimarinibacterium flocculans]|uniref:sodium-dependent bicarbonate transport family permease n=1 Tax=Sinimarinibacterium flocculans TaxID=985250 RepID=UPI0024936684|nr:sodium-dependent bicarbonate transport family permease [Sinimarinibacterium flocculans]
MTDALLDPAVLFFVLGIGAGLLRSNLEVPQPVVRWLTLYLLMAVGLKGGFTLARSGIDADAAAALGASLVMALLVPLIAFAAFRLVTSVLQAGALAASYGSVSVVTFVAATQHLQQNAVSFSGTMSVALVIMEMPAVLLGIALARRGDAGAQATPWGHLLKDSARDGAPLLLMGSLLIGWVTGERGATVMEPFSGDLFKGMLALFLLQMGLDVARRFGDLRGLSPWLLVLALVIPLAAATTAMGLGTLLGLGAGDLALLATLSASASYIVAPAVLRHALPDASPALYLGLPMALTFPFNLLIGIGLYASVARVLA